MADLLYDYKLENQYARTRFFGYKADSNGLTVDHWWSDIHDLQFRPEVPIFDRRVLHEQVDKFNANRDNFSWLDFSGATKVNHPARKYGERWAVEFYYQGDWYKTITTDAEKVRRVYENADEIDVLNEQGSTIRVPNVKVTDITNE